MRILLHALVALLCCAAGAPAQVRLYVTVMDRRTAEPVKDLKSGDFEVLEDRRPRPVAAAEFTESPVDAMLLVDTSLVGESVRPVAADLIRQLAEKEQMAVVSFASSADLIQDFTSSKDLLLRSLDGIRYGNLPQVLDALYAAIDGGFQAAVYRKVVLLLTAGLTASDRVSESTVIRLARRNGVAIYPIYVSGNERSLLEELARRTGGASFSLRELGKTAPQEVAQRIFAVARSGYYLTISGNFPPGERLEIRLKRPGRFFVSARALE